MTLAPNGRRTVLVVEDSPTEQAMIADCLYEAGYSVVLAGDGDEVGEKIRSIAVDLVVLDLILPRVNGYEVCRSLRSNPRTQHIPIVMLTTSENPRDIRACYEAGASAYIVKPGTFEELSVLAHDLCRHWLHWNRIPDPVESRC